VNELIGRFKYIVLDTPAGGVNHLSSLMNSIDQVLFIFDMSNSIAVNGSIDALHSFIDYYEDFYEDYKHEIEKILKDGIDIGEFRDMNKEGVATMLMAFLDGLGLQIIIMKNPKVFNKIKSEAIESFMRGILK
jgi:hypothetical protein